MNIVLSHHSKHAKTQYFRHQHMLKEKQSMEHAIISIQVLMITKYPYIFNFSKPSG